MAASKRVVTVTVWETQRRHEDDPSVKPNDWRGPSASLELAQTCRVYTKDQGFKDFSGSAEPDWSLGAYVMDNANSRIMIDFSGDPGEFFRECFKRGLAVEGCLVGTDLQIHN